MTCFLGSMGNVLEIEVAFVARLSRVFFAVANILLEVACPEHSEVVAVPSEQPDAGMKAMIAEEATGNFIVTICYLVLLGIEDVGQVAVSRSVAKAMAWAHHLHRIST